MGIWKGIYMGLQDIEAQKEKEADREERRQERMADIIEKRRAIALELLAKGVFNKSTSKAVEHFGTALNSRYGVSEETVANLAASSGATGLERALEVLDNQNKKYAELGRTVPQGVITEVFESAVVTPHGGPVDFDAVEAYVGEQFSDLDKKIFALSSAQAPRVYIPEPAVIPPPKLQDVALMEERAAGYLRQSAGIESQNINNALNQVYKAEANETDPTKLAELEATKTWLLGRKDSVESALASAEGSNGNLTGLVGLYGNEFFEEMRKADPRMGAAVLSPLFKNSAPIAPKKVDSQQTLDNLIKAGVIKEGEPVEIIGAEGTISSGSKRVNSEAELKELALSGELKVGDVVEILDPETGEYVAVRIGD